MPQPPPGRPESILLATDLSPRCDRALDRAAQLCLHWGARLVALHVLAPESELQSFHEEHDLHSWQRPGQPLAIAERQLRMSLVDRAERITTLVEGGDPAEAIARVAAARGCGLIVTGTARDESLGRLFVGATVEKLTRRSTVPVLTVKLRARAAYRNVVVATDFSDSSRYALEAAAGWFDKQPLTVFNAYQVPLSGHVTDARKFRDEYRVVVADESAAFLKATRIPVAVRSRLNTVLEYGTPQHLLPEYVVDKDVELVVVGTRGRGAITTMLLGSVAKEILATVPCDILVVREAKATLQAPGV